ncbi:MAG: lytic transglycosylase domain-containing protein [Marmoricola sp.]
MSEKHVAKHRSTPSRPPRSRLRHRIRNAAVLSGMAVAATGLVVSTGVLSQPLPIDGAAAALSTSSPAKSLSQDELAEREQRASRSTDDRRPEADRVKTRALSNASGVAVTKTEDLSNADPRELAKALMPQYGISSSEFGCLDNIWSQESGWNVHAANPTSSAYGIPQALPGSKMSSAGPDWENNPETQIRWGLGYIKGRYGSACAAWSYKQGAGWY